MPFKRGCKSPNPLGRPKGSGYRQQLFSKLVIPHIERLLDTAINLALSGNEMMLKLFLEKILPAKPTDEPITAIDSLDGTLSEKGHKALNLIISGELTPSEGAALLQAITSQAKLIETTELIERIKKLEEACNGNKKS